MNKRFLRIGIMTALICLLAGLFVGTVFADEEEDWPDIGYAQVTTNTVMRSKKNVTTLASAVKVIPKSSVVEVLKNAGGGWYKVKYGSRKGFIQGVFLTDEDDEDLSDDMAVKTLAVDLTARSSAKLLADNIVTTLRAGAEVTIVAERADNWVRVSYSEDADDVFIQNGFFDSDAKTGDGFAWKAAMQDIYIRSSASSGSSNITATVKKGKKLKIIGSSGNWFKVRYKGAVRYAKMGYFINETKGEFVQETAASRVNFRSSQSTTENNVIKILSVGTAVKVYKATSKNWYEVKVGNTSGYIQGGYFASDKEVDDGDTSSVTRTTTAALRLREGRGLTYDVVTVIPKNSSVTLIMKYGDWYKVRYAGDAETYTGWVDGNYLS